MHLGGLVTQQESLLIKITKTRDRYQRLSIVIMLLLTHKKSIEL